MLQPGAKDNTLVGLHDDYLKIRVKAAATDNRANQALIKLLAQLSKLPANQIELISGSQSRYKRVAITGYTSLPAWLSKIVAPTSESSQFNQDYIENHTRYIPYLLEIFDKIDSTNTYLKNITNSKNSLPRICLANEQTAGKGRFNHKWYSPPGQNIYLSCLYSFTKPITELSGLGLVIALAVVKSFKQILPNAPIMVKWPNDIVVKNKKLCGVLNEVKTKRSDRTDVVVGIGANINMVNADGSTIDQKWTSLQQLFGRKINRDKLASNLINNLLHYLQLFDVSDLVAFADEWQEYDALQSHEIQIHQNNQIFQGIARGIDHQGRLLLQLDNNQLKTFTAGDASIAK